MERRWSGSVGPSRLAGALRAAAGVAEVDDVDFAGGGDDAVVEQVAGAAEDEEADGAEGAVSEAAADFGALGEEQEGGAEFVAEEVGGGLPVVAPPGGGGLDLGVGLRGDHDGVRRVQGHGQRRA